MVSGDCILLKEIINRSDSTKQYFNWNEDGKCLYLRYQMIFMQVQIDFRRLYAYNKYRVKCRILELY